MLKVINRTDATEIYITGDIVDDADGAFLQSWDAGEGYQWPAEIRAQLDAAKGKPLTVYINSNGGSVPAGVAMANMIQRHDAPTRAVIDGWCCSIATQIFFAADARAMPSNAYLMIHKPMTSVPMGNSDDMLLAAEFLDTIQAGLETTYQKAARPELDAKKIHDMVEHETWLTGTEAAAMFDIELLDAVPVLNCVASKMAANMKPPEELNIKPEAVTPPVFDCAEDADGISEASKEFAAALVDEMAVNNDNEAARIKAALAIAKGVMTR